MIDQYEYKEINDKSKQFVIDSLNEDPLRVNDQIECLRRCVKSMPHLTCPTDSKFLLQFLRISRFNQEIAQQRLDNFCTIRGSPRGCPQYFDYNRIDDAMIEEFLDSQVLTPLGRNDDGELIALLAAKKWDPERIPVIQWATLMFMGYDIFTSEEYTQIYGIRFFVDLSYDPIKVAREWSDPHFVMDVQNILQNCYPWRYKEIIFFNETEIFGAFLNMWSFYMNEHTGHLLRIKHGEQHKLDEIPGLKNLLPTEYGGHGGPWNELTAKWKHQFKTFYKNGSPYSGVSVGESKRPKETCSYLSESPEYTGRIFDCDDIERK